MSKKYKIGHLSQKFYQDYDPDTYHEIEKKQDRPYLVMLLKIDDNTFAIPFRTNVNHTACYKFKNSDKKEKGHSPGLDYSKAVIVNNPEYIGPNAYINDKEYLELSEHFYFIRKQFTSYVDGYKKYITDGADKYIAQKYKYTTLQYYHNELGIERTSNHNVIKTNDKTVSSDNDSVKQNDKALNDVPDPARFDNIINQKVCDEAYVTPTNHFGNIEYD